MSLPDLESTPQRLLLDFLHRVAPTEACAEAVELADAVGRLLAGPVYADEDSPPSDLSGVDGYALCACDLRSGFIPLSGDAALGGGPGALEPGSALRVHAGGRVPAGADLIVALDEVVESESGIALAVPVDRLRVQGAIRRRGENLRRGEVVVQQGELISASTCVALASLGVVRPQVRSPLRTALIVTGNVPEDAGVAPLPAPTRDGNGPGLAAMLRSLRWVDLTWRGHVEDRLDSITGALAGALRGNDAVLITGGLSGGPQERVVAAVRAAGCGVVFDRLPVRPGERAFAAFGERDQLVIGLPGDPVSALLLANFLGLPALQKRAGFGRPSARSRLVYLDDLSEVSPSLSCFNLVRVAGDGRARTVPSRGSGDIVSAARADGFVLVPPGAIGPGPWPFFAWV